MKNTKIFLFLFLFIVPLMALKLQGQKNIQLNDSMEIEKLNKSIGNQQADNSINSALANLNTRDFDQSQQINSKPDKNQNKVLLEQESYRLQFESEFRKSKNIFLGIGILITLIFGAILTLLLFFYSKKAKESKINTQLLNKQNAELLDANTTKEKFLSILGHDLKNPFNSVLGFSNLIIDQWESLDEKERFHITNEIYSSVQSIYELLDNLLIWSKTQSESTKPIPKKFDLNEIVLDVYDIFRNQANFKRINVRLEISETNEVFADPNMIATVIRNLLSNSLKFTREGGQIVIRTQRKNDMAEFSISDNGKGILPDDLKRIFENKDHHTTKGTARETGSGLGLLLSKDFIQRSNGLIWVESKPGEGSLFTFTLPLS